MANAPHWSERVRRGYDTASYAYRADDAESGPYANWIHRLDAALSRSSRVVDLGCGCGVPVARDLAAAGHAVVGVDISQTQIERARRLVPAGEFHCNDLTAVDFPEDSFDAAVFLYSIIHLPLDQQPVILQRVARWLRPGGVLALIAGHDAWTGSEDRWLGSDATMWWSQADSSTYRGWLEAVGFLIDEEVVVPEGPSGHTLFWAHRVSDRAGGSDE